MLNSIKLTCFAAGIAQAMGIEPPIEAELPMEVFSHLTARYAVSGKAEKVLIYNPDAIAFWLYQKYTQRFLPVMERTQMTIPMQAMFPPKTPVCFATMYTGAEPIVHGIRSYTKPIVKTDSLFDAAVRAGKKVALIAVEGSSMSIIFGGEKIDYFFGKDDAAVEQIALDIIKKGEHDLVSVYHMDYDEAIHATTPESNLALKALNQHIQSFATLADCAAKYWAKNDVLVCFAPDHGLHQTIESVGDHFADIPVDMNMVHFYGLYPASR